MTEDKLMTIREMCDTYDVTPRTLRFYEQKELLSPIREGQKRLYTKRERGRLTLILRGKRFGFSLEDIRQLLDMYSVGDQQRMQLEKAYRDCRSAAGGHDPATRRTGRRHWRAEGTNGMGRQDDRLE